MIEKLFNFISNNSPHIVILYLGNTHILFMFHESYVVDGENTDELVHIEHETQTEPRVNTITGLLCSGRGFPRRISLYFLVFLAAPTKTPWNSRCLAITLVLEM